jgi:hypothetical protein
LYSKVVVGQALKSASINYLFSSFNFALEKYYKQKFLNKKKKKKFLKTKNIKQITQKKIKN